MISCVAAQLPFHPERPIKTISLAPIEESMVKNKLVTCIVNAKYATLWYNREVYG